MDSIHQVILLLKVLILIGPLAVYFMVLGLLNSQSTPRLVNARSDFLILTGAVLPTLLAPAAWTLGRGSWWILVPVFAVAGLAMRALLPRPNSGWVMYNLSAARAQVLVQRCLDELGWAYQAAGRVLTVPDRGLLLRFSGLPVLRNVTCHLTFENPGGAADTVARLRGKLEAAFARQQLLPSPAGSCLMLVGIGMMILPLWMMSRYSDAIAQVVSRLLLS